MNSPSDKFKQYALFASVTLAAIAATAVVSVSHNEYFRPYLAGLPPVLAIILAACIGFGSLHFLRYAGLAIVAKNKSRPGTMRAV